MPNEILNRWIIDSATEFAMIATNLDGHVTTWNEGARLILGWDEGEMLGQTAERIFSPEDRASDRPAVEMRCALEAGSGNDERWHLRKNGERFWASGKMMVLRDDAGAPVGFLKILRDQTEQRLATETLRGSQTNIRLLMDSMAEGFYAVDREGVTTVCNAAFLRMMGFAQEEDAVGRKLHDIIHKQHPDGSHYDVRDCPIYTCASQGTPAHVKDELFFPINGDPPMPVEYWAFPIRNDGELQGAICTFLPIGDQLNEDERLQLALAAGTIVGTWVWDMTTDTFIADDRFASSFGLSRELCRTGLPLDQVLDSIHEEDRPLVNAAIAEAIGRGGPYRCQYRARQQDGVYHWFEANGRVELDGEGKPVRFPGILLDIEARRKAEVEVRELNRTLEQRVADGIAEREKIEEALRQSQKMEAVGQLTGGLAHDFNNLLTGMMGNLELLQTRIARGRLDDLDRFIVAAQGAGRRAAALTQRLLAFSRRQTLDPRPSDVNRLIAGMEDMLRRTVGPANTIEIVGAAGAWTVNIDAGQLENALLNLCINARDAMPDGGRLTIETANKWIDDRFAKERDLEPGQYLSVCVTDTGTGMSAETIERAFEPFYTTKPLGEGTGLGLSMIYGFARQSGGQVRIYSEVGSGTTICIYLPRHLGDADEVHSAEPLKEIQGAHGQTVLVVDDEATIRHLIDEVLDEIGYTVIGAADGAAGIKVLQSGARIELLITDVGLPNGMNGRQVADAARSIRPDLKVLFITGYAENAAVGNGHLEPGMALLTKPFTMEALALKVADMMKA